MARTKQTTRVVTVGKERMKCLTVRTPTGIKDGLEKKHGKQSGIKGSSKKTVNKSKKTVSKTINKSKMTVSKKASKINKMKQDNGNNEGIPLPKPDLLVSKENIGSMSK
jgi:hypothetical protein